MTEFSPSVASGLAAYQSVSTHGDVEDNDPHHLIELLLDAAIARTSKAKSATERKLIAEKGEATSEAITILETLRDSLNMNEGGSLAQHLDDLYDYMQRRLALANANSNTGFFDEVISLLNELRGAWKQIPRSVRTRAQ